MVINTNASALNAIQNLEKNEAKLSSSMEKLSSGLKINGAADDSANLAIATRMAAQIGSLIQASANAQAGVSLINIADGALNSIAESITSLRALAIQAANGTLTSIDRASINTNAKSHLDQINSVVSQTDFNGLNLLDGTLDTTLQIGTQAGDILAIQINSTNTADIGSVIVQGDAVQTALRVGDLVINGAAIAPSKSDGLSTEHADASAIAIANAINTSGTDADVQAAANPTITDTVNFEASANSGGAITINGVETTLISITNSLNSNVENAIVAINDIKSETGVEASADLEGKLVLTAADGRNITVNYGPGIDNTDLGAVAAGTVTSSITLTSSSPITIGGSSPEHAGLIGGTTSTLVPLSSAQLDTQANAVASLAIIDGALDTVSNLRANLGALENRLYSMIDNLGNNSVNLMDAKSQIMDTDFAIEMANFAKLQILQQASTTMLAQANAQPQSILKLLQ
jgi:flagellin